MSPLSVLTSFPSCLAGISKNVAFKSFIHIQTNKPTSKTKLIPSGIKINKYNPTTAYSKVARNAITPINKKRKKIFRKTQHFSSSLRSLHDNEVSGSTRIAP